MRKSRKRNGRAGRLLFTVVLLFVVLCAGFLLKGRISPFFDKLIAGTITGDGNDATNGGVSVEKNNTEKNNADSDTDHINNNINNNKDNKNDSNNHDDPQNNQNNEHQGNSNDRQPAENVDDILVLVNKKRYLDSSYKPNDLVVPNVKFSFDEEREKKYMRKEAAEALEELFERAYKEGVYIFALSGYRSYSTQKWLFENKASEIGEEKANKIIARPGESEHQTGLAMDITSQSVQFDLKTKFGETEEGKWVKDNAHKFGFIIRYAKDKEGITGYNYEPWHLRYVGKKVAEEIYNKGIALEEYLS
ncbi:MAG: M15 family metallopeptidase [Natronincolaceae bacterium]|jgi:D-alanyl-D-alanine carboxypeptidase|nr:M15 family metallopeptidase [Bacillota bacterium]NLK90017.1 M15 family metallopeptidase [Clostridiales bacterium]